MCFHGPTSPTSPKKKTGPTGPSRFEEKRDEKRDIPVKNGIPQIRTDKCSTVFGPVSVYAVPFSVPFPFIPEKTKTVGKNGIRLRRKRDSSRPFSSLVRARGSLAILAGDFSLSPLGGLFLFSKTRSLFHTPPRALHLHTEAPKRTSTSVHLKQFRLLCSTPRNVFFMSVRLLYSAPRNIFFLVSVFGAALPATLTELPARPKPKWQTLHFDQIATLIILATVMLS
jgi:hypothetical protein